MAQQNRTCEGRVSDLSMSWVVKRYGDDWEEWRALADEWLSEQTKSLVFRITSLSLFFEFYLMKYAPYASDVRQFFTGVSGHRCSSDEFKSILLKDTKMSDKLHVSQKINYLVDFLDWILEKHLNVNVDGVKIVEYANPFERSHRQQRASETVLSPLPYRFIKHLRKLLCPKPTGNFTDWLWAHSQTGQGKKHGQWIEISSDKIDRHDLDCVWREKTITRNGKKTSIFQVWSPVSAVLLYVKLHLPLRTYQLRMLDSGEADTWRYKNGKWIINDVNSFSLGTEDKPFAKGVFRRIVDNFSGSESTGIYVNTNKTADLNKSEFDRGYVIPWQNEQVLYWLEKLRDWQEKYNPISSPTDCTTLTPVETRQIRSKEYLSSLGHICFLFRTPTNRIEDRDKPISDGPLSTLWYRLMEELEKYLISKGETLSNGDPIELVHKYANANSYPTKTYFPLHSLRVSLISSYILDANVPIPIVAKLLAGHTRLIMTLYYTKISLPTISKKLTEAEKRLEETTDGSLITFLKDSEMKKINDLTAFNDFIALDSVLSNRKPAGWEERYHGVCLVGGNNARTDENLSIGGCWNGGPPIKSASYQQSSNQPVPNGPENCTRCRFFITSARYLPSLVAHLNLKGYLAAETASHAVRLEGEIKKLEDEQYLCEKSGRIFSEHDKLRTLYTRHNKKMVEVDELTKDWISTFRLIKRVIEIERSRGSVDSDSYVAVGIKDDVNHGIQLVETNSQLMQISLICRDAQIFPEISDEIIKTSTISKLSQKLSKAMMFKGYQPILLSMSDEEQLITINAIMRKMALLCEPESTIEGYKKASGYIELEEYLTNGDLLSKSLEILESADAIPLKVSPSRKTTKRLGGTTNVIGS